VRLLTRRQAFGVAAVIALIVAGLVYMVLNQQAAGPPPVAPTTIEVVVATQDIPPYKTVTSDMIETREMSSAAAPEGALTAPEQAVGQIAQVQIARGQTLTRGQITARTAAQGLTFVIPEGLRAVTVALDAISGVGGFVYPGDHVDVLTTLQQGEVTLTRTIVQNVEVLAMNDLTSRPSVSRGQDQATDQQGAAGGTSGSESEAPAAEQVKSATLAVTPDQAQAIILSAFKGAVHLVLRPREDEAIVSLSGQSDYALMGLSAPAGEKPPEEEEVATGPMGQPVGWPAGMYAPPGVSGPAPAAPAAAAAPAAPTVEVIRGTEREVVTPQ